MTRIPDSHFDALIAAAALAVIAAWLLCGCMVTVSPEGEGLAITTSSPLPATTNTVAASSLAATLSAGCAMLGIPLPENISYHGIVGLLAAWVWLEKRKAKRKEKNEKLVRKDT